MLRIIWCASIKLLLSNMRSAENGFWGNCKYAFVREGNMMQVSLVACLMGAMYVVFRRMCNCGNGKYSRNRLPLASMSASQHMSTGLANNAIWTYPLQYLHSCCDTTSHCALPNHKAMFLEFTTNNNQHTQCHWSIFSSIYHKVVTALTMTLSYFCGCSPVLEQPISSTMPRLEPLKSVLAGIAAHKTVVWHGAYSGTSPKCLQLWSPRDLGDLVRPRPQLLSSNLVVTKKRMVDGRMKSSYTGMKDKLKDSQTYCKAFGSAVATLVDDWVKTN